MIVGRNAELELLNGFLSSVPQTGGQLVLVCGEAGIGKSFFIECFLQQTRLPHRSAIAWCDPLNTPRPLGPVRDLSAILLKDDVSSDGKIDYFERLVSFAHNSEQTLILVIEDLHWADQKSLDWLVFFGRRLSQLPVLLICSYRDDEIGPSHELRKALSTIPAARKTYVELPPLSVDHVRQMGSHCRYTAAMLHEITGGQPYFVAELLNSDADSTMLPQSISDVINARLAVLSPRLQRFLETIACSPGELPDAIVKRLRFDDVTALCDRAIAQRILLAVGKAMKFRHEVARLIVAARMTPGELQEAHKMFLTAHLAQPDAVQELDTIVFHAEGAQDADVLLEYAQRAASNAATLGAHREAALFLGSALEYVDDTDIQTAAEMNERWAYEAGLSLGIDDDVIAARERAVLLWTQIGRPDRVGENLRWLSRLHWYRGEANRAERYILQAIKILETDTLSPETGKAYALRAQFFMLQEDMVEAVKWAKRALDVARKTNDFESQAHALNTMGSAKLFRGDLEGEIDLRRSLEVAHRHAFHEQAARAYTNLSECLIELRLFDRAEALLEEGIAFDTANDLDAWTYYLIGRKAQLRFEQNRYNEAIKIAQGVLAQPNQTVLMQMPARIILARAGIRRGDDGADVILHEALNHADQIDEPQYQLTALIAHVELGVLQGDPCIAAEALSRLAAFDAAAFSPAKRAEYLFWRHLADAPVDTTDTLDPYFRVLAGAYLEAADAFEANGDSYLAGWTLAKHASDASYARADALFQSCGALAARRALRQRTDLPTISSKPRGPYSAAREHPYDLTAKEQTVLAMMADGKSNAIIADQLSRSRRTIENHVSSILSKLNCKNRLEAALRAQSEPWILPKPA